MSLDPSGRYRGKNFDPSYRSQHQQQQRYNNDDSQDPGMVSSNGRGLSRASQNESARLYDRNDSGHDPRIQYGSRSLPRNSIPRGPRDSRAPLTTHMGPTTSPDGDASSSRDPRRPIVLAADQDGNTNPPSHHLQPSSSTNQPEQLTSPSSTSLPSGESLGSLDKLRQFKAEVEASRRQRQNHAPDLEPSGLAQMAESFLKSQQNEIGEASGGLAMDRLSMSAQSRERELKETLRQRLQSHETESVPGAKRERPEAGEIVEDSQPKRLRPDRAIQERVQEDAPMGILLQNLDRLGGDDQFDQRRKQPGTLNPTEEIRPDVPRRPTEPPSGPRGKTAPHARSPERKSILPTVRAEQMSAPPPVAPRKKDYRASDKNFVPTRFETLADPTKNHAEQSRRASSPHGRPSFEYGNGGRFTKRDETPSSVSRRDSSIFERRSLSQ